MLQDYIGMADGFPFWVAVEIPTPTPAQLATIGMKLDGDRPRECKPRCEDRIWDGNYSVFNLSKNHKLVGTYRWHLVKADPAKATGQKDILERLRGYNLPGRTYFSQRQTAVDIQDAANEIQALRDCLGVDSLGLVPNKPPVAQAGKVRCSIHLDCTGEINGNPCGHHGEHDGNGDCGAVCGRSSECVPQAGKDEGHYSCIGCDYAAANRCRTWGVPKCDSCYQDNLLVVDKQERKNWTPKGEDVGGLEQSLLDTIAQACDEAGRLSLQTIVEFIRDLADKAKKPKGEDAPAPDGFYEAWADVFNTCLGLGMAMPDKLTPKEATLTFIRDLHRRAGESTDSKILDWAETHPEKAMQIISSWWATCGEGSREVAFNFRGILKDEMKLNDLQDGIRAVTNRMGEK